MRILGFKSNVPLPTEEIKVASPVAMAKPAVPFKHTTLLNASSASVPDTAGLGLGVSDHVGRQLYPVCPLALADRHGKGADGLFKTSWGLGYGMGGGSEGNLRGDANYLFGRARDRKRGRRSDEGAHTTGAIE